MLKNDIVKALLHFSS